MLLPLGIGLFAKARYERLSAGIKPFLDRLSSISLVLLIVLISLANFDKVLQVFGTRGILAGLLLIACGCLMEWLLGGCQLE
jgi:BASS family bile acid:Na+ symporter